MMLSKLGVCTVQKKATNFQKLACCTKDLSINTYLYIAKEGLSDFEIRL